MVHQLLLRSFSNKAKNAYAFDLSAACSGFLFGMSTATSYIESGRYKKVLLIGADMMSSIVDYTDSQLVFFLEMEQALYWLSQV